MDNVTLRLVKPFPIEVTPEWDNSESAESAPASVSVIPLDGQTSGSTGVDAGPPFTAHLQGHPGRYLFAPGQFGNRGYYVSAVIVDGHDVLGQAVELDGPTAVKAILKNDGGSVRGTVEKGGGATVVLIADPTAYARFGMTARCDGEGNFTIADVPPGNYTAVAFQVADVLYLPPSDQLNRIDSARGERVKIEPGGSETVTLKVN